MAAKRPIFLFWATTGLFCLVMAFSAYQYLSSPDMIAAFQHLGFPAYFRVQLAVFKFLGVLVLLLPVFPARIKDFAYAGFAISMVSAAIAHSCSGDPAMRVVLPLLFLGLLAISYFSYHKTLAASELQPA